MSDDAEKHIEQKYTARKPQLEARADAMLYAVIHFSATKFEPAEIIANVEDAGFEESERIRVELPLWEAAIQDAIEGKWDKMRERIEKGASNSWKASKVLDDEDAFKSAEAFQRLAQSL